MQVLRIYKASISLKIDVNLILIKVISASMTFSDDLNVEKVGLGSIMPSPEHWKCHFLIEAKM